jgi:predicted nucleic-acid-binding protein
VSFGVDTSVLVRLLVGEPAALASKARERLLAVHRLGQPVFVSDLVIAEAYYALKFHYGSAPEDVRRSLLAMLTSGLIQPEPGSAVLAVLAVLQSKIGGKAGFVDRLIQARYEADGLTTLTLDRAQAKLGDVEFLG